MMNRERRGEGGRKMKEREEEGEGRKERERVGK
jgi:hypothetical protein